MLDTVQLHYEELGSGQPVVMLHGFPFNHTIWQAQAGVLSQSYRVILPDLRGHGQSPAPDGVYAMDVMARDVLALLHVLGIERAAWVGHSMGGYVLMAALRVAPERIAAAVLVATHPHPDSEERQAARRTAAARVFTEGKMGVTQEMIASLFAPGGDSSPQAAALLDLMRKTPREGLAGALRGMAERPSSVAVLRAAKLPALVIGGQHDQIVSPEVARSMAEIMPGGRFVSVEGAGHMLMIEQPDATATLIRRFLAGLYRES